MTKDVETVLLKTTSIIYALQGNKRIRYATCFFCLNENNEEYIITNKHVLENANGIQLYITINGKGQFTNITLGRDVKVHPVYDLCAIPFANINKELKLIGNTDIVFIGKSIIDTKYDHYKHIEEIVMIGYPSNIINESENMPVIRKGITATSLSQPYNGEDVFVTDIPTVGGSSGSPIFVIREDELHLVGINFRNYIDKTPIYKNGNRLYHKRIIGYTNIPNGLGIAIKSRVLLDIL